MRKVEPRGALVVEIRQRSLLQERSALVVFGHQSRVTHRADRGARGEGRGASESGSAGRLLIDTSDAGFTLDEIVAAQDSRLLFGSITAGGIVAVSSDNTFDDLIEGLSLTVGEATTTPVTVTLITATATDAQGNTSEFSQVFTVTQLPAPTTLAMWVIVALTAACAAARIRKQ